MKKIIATLLIATMLLTGTALAASYDANGIAFEYDDAVFEIAVDEQDDEEAIVVLFAVDENLDNTFVNISLAPLPDDETFPTLEEYTQETNDNEEEAVQVKKLDSWLDFRNVYNYSSDADDEDGKYHSETFYAPVEANGKVAATLEIYASQDAVDDEELGMLLSDAISGILDSLKVTV